MEILKKIKEYFLTYGKLDEHGKIYANHMPVEAVEYSIIELPSANGGTLQRFGRDEVKQFQFSFDTKVHHSQGNDETNFNNSKFYGELQEWVEDNNINKILPDVENCMSIEIMQTPYLKGIDPNGHYAVHSMSGRITYYKERKYTWQTQ